jgi:hypothetical protein
MDKADAKEGILCFLEDGLGRTFEEIQDFLKKNSVSGFKDDSALSGLLDEMREEGLIEQRFMADGSDAVDYAIEEDGVAFMKAHPAARKKWNTGRPDPNIQKLMQEKMENLEDME